MREHVDGAARRPAVRESLLERRADGVEIQRVLRQRLDRPLNIARNGLGRLAEERVGYSLASWQNTIWYKRSWAITLRTTIDGLIYGLLTAGTFGWLWPKA